MSNTDENADTVFPFRDLWTPDSGRKLFCRAKAYQEAAAGRIRVVKIGHRSFVRQSDFARYLASLPPAEIGKKKAA